MKVSRRALFGLTATGAAATSQVTAVPKSSSSNATAGASGAPTTAKITEHVVVDYGRWEVCYSRDEWGKLTPIFSIEPRRGFAKVL